MAGNPYRKVNVGEILPGIPAQLFNTLIDVANLHNSGNIGAKSAAPLTRSLPERGIVVPVKNISGSDVSRFSALRIVAPIIDPDDNPQYFKNRPTLFVDLPEAENYEKFVITQEPIADDKVGLAMLSGVSACLIDVQDESHTYADTIQGDETKLRSCLWGPIEILTPVTATGEEWHYVQLAGFRRAFRFRGQAAEAIAQDVVGTVEVTERTAATTYTATGETVEALNDIDVDIEDNAILEVTFDGLDSSGDPMWRIDNADFECP